MIFDSDQWWSNFRPTLQAYLDQLFSIPSPRWRPDKDLRLRIQRADRGRKPAQINCSADHFRETYENLIKVGELNGISVVFGKPIQGRRKRVAQPLLQLVFKPCITGRRSVAFQEVQPNADKLKAELNRSNRQLWDTSSNQPGKEYRAIEYAAEIRLRLKEVIDGIKSGQSLSSLQPPNLAELWVALDDLLGCCLAAKDKRFAARLSNASKIYTQFSAALPDEGLQKFFSSPVESRDVQAIRNAVVNLATELQRPPTHKEVRNRIGWNLETKEFKTKLADAGLWWLPTQPQLKKLGIVKSAR